MVTATKELPWLGMDRSAVDALRQSLAVDLSAPTRIAYYRFPNAEALYSFLDEDTEVRLNGKSIQLPAHTVLWLPR